MNGRSAGAVMAIPIWLDPICPSHVPVASEWKLG